MQKLFSPFGCYHFPLYHPNQCSFFQAVHSPVLVDVLVAVVVSGSGCYLYKTHLARGWKRVHVHSYNVLFPAPSVFASPVCMCVVVVDFFTSQTARSLPYRFHHKWFLYLECVLWNPRRSPQLPHDICCIKHLVFASEKLIFNRVNFSHSAIYIEVP